MFELVYGRLSFP